MGKVEPRPRRVDSLGAAADNAVEWMHYFGHESVRVWDRGDGSSRGRQSGCAEAGGEFVLAWITNDPFSTTRFVLQQLIEAADAPETDLLFFSAAGFTVQAIEFAEPFNLALFTYESDGVLTGVNDAAVKLLFALPDQWRTIAEQQAYDLALSEFLDAQRQYELASRLRENAIDYDLALNQWDGPWPPNGIEAWEKNASARHAAAIARDHAIEQEREAAERLLQAEQALEFTGARLDTEEVDIGTAMLHHLMVERSEARAS